MAGIEELGGRKGDGSERHVLLSRVSQGLGIAAAGAVAFSVLWSAEKYCIDVVDVVENSKLEVFGWVFTGEYPYVYWSTPTSKLSSQRLEQPPQPSPFQYCGQSEKYASTLTTASFGAFVGACLESYRHIQRRPPHYVQLVVPYAISLLAVHIEPFLSFKYSVVSEFGYGHTQSNVATARLALSKTKRIVDISNQYSVLTAAIVIVLVRCMYLAKSSFPPPPDGDEETARGGGLVAYVSLNKALPVLTRISIIINLLWMFFTVAVWMFKEMPYYGLGVLSGIVAILHFSCWSLLDKDITSSSTHHTNSTSSDIAQAVNYYKILQQWIFALTIGRMIYWEFLDDSILNTYLPKHFYSLIASLTACGVTASYSRSTGQIITIVGIIFALLLRMVVASLFLTGIKGSIIGSSIGLGISVLAIGAVLAGVV